MFLSSATIIAWLIAYRYGILLFLIAVEGPLVTMAAGFLSAHGYMNIWLVYIICVVGDVISDFVYFGIGYWGRSKIVSKYGHFLHISLAHVEKLERLFERHTGKTLVISKITHVAGVPFIIAAGLAKVKYYKFLFYDLIATVPKTLIFLLLGYYFGKAFDTFNNYLWYGTLISLFLLLLYIIGYFYLGKYSDKNIDKIV